MDCAPLRPAPKPLPLSQAADDDSQHMSLHPQTEANHEITNEDEPTDSGSSDSDDDRNEFYFDQSSADDQSNERVSGLQEAELSTLPSINTHMELPSNSSTSSQSSDHAPPPSSDSSAALLPPPPLQYASLPVLSVLHSPPPLSTAPSPSGTKPLPSVPLKPLPSPRPSTAALPPLPPPAVPRTPSPPTDFAADLAPKRPPPPAPSTAVTDAPPQRPPPKKPSSQEAPSRPAGGVSTSAPSPATAKPAAKPLPKPLPPPPALAGSESAHAAKALPQRPVGAAANDGADDVILRNRPPAVTAAVRPVSSPNLMPSAAEPANGGTFQRAHMPSTMSTPTGSLSLTEGIVKEGLLAKKGGRRRNWKQRWFVLRQHTLSYYRQKGDPKPKGQIVLAHVLLESSDHKLHCFALAGSHRTYLIQATSEAEKKDWMEAIKTCMRMQA